LISVVFPEPRKPVTTVTGIFIDFAMVFGARIPLLRAEDERYGQCALKRACWARVSRGRCHLHTCGRSRAATRRLQQKPQANIAETRRLDHLSVLLGDFRFESCGSRFVARGAHIYAQDFFYAMNVIAARGTCGTRSLALS
jgi:hypothetical protein